MKEYWTIRSVTSETWDKFDSRTCALAHLWKLRAWAEEKGKTTEYKLIRHTVNAKPRGAKPGTWAWACEQMLAGRDVRLPDWRAGVVQRINVRGLMASNSLSSCTYTPCQVTEEDMRATDWQVVP